MTQYIAGIFEFVCGNTFGCVAFVSSSLCDVPKPTTILLMYITRRTNATDDIWILRESFA